MKIYLDDERKCPEGWELAKTADEAIAFLESGRGEEISLDHDLAFEHYAGVSDTNEIFVPEEKPREKTGYDVTLWLRQKVHTDPTFRMPVVRLHTMNPVGRKNMAAVLEDIRRILWER